MNIKGINSNQLRRLLSFVIAFVFTVGIVFTGVPQSAYADGSLPTYLNPTAAVEDRVADLLGRMTVDEKVGQMLQPEKGSISIDDVKNYYLGSVLSGGGSFPGSGAEADSTMEKWSALYDSMQDAALSTRLGIPLLYGVDAVHGHNNVKGATIFPHSIGLGATRDTALVKEIGAAVAEEVKATGVNWTFAPTIADPQNIKWGRSYEGFGDDLNLVAQMGVAYTQGLQGDSISDLKKSDKVIATVKHYIGEGWTDNGTNQGNVTVKTKEQVAADLIKPYKDAVDAGARTVMVSYNSINGIKCHASKYLITDVLKGSKASGGLGFDGIVITDYNGIEQIGKDEAGNTVSGLKAQLKVAINAGIDMLMETGNWKNCYNNIKTLIQEDIATPGSGIPMSRIDDAVSRILRVKFQAGTFENPKTDSDLASEFGSQENREVARRAVSESLVLLKNDNVNGTPILSQLKNMNKIFVAGKNANDLGNQCGGWTITWQGKSGNTLTTGTTILKGIQDALAGTGKTVTYNKNGRVPADSDVAIVVVGETPYAESNGDTANLELSAEDKATLQNVKDSGKPTIVVLVSGRPMIINDYLNDWQGLIAAWLPGTEGQGVADVLFGNKDFVGKMPIKWPFYTEALPITDSSSPYILFNFGYGLNKATATPVLPPVPEKPRGALPTGVTAIDIPANRVEAESPYAVSGWDLNAPSNNFIESGSGRSGNKSIGWTSSGKWLKYFVNAAQAGWYKVDLGVASPDGASGAIQLRDGNGVVLCTASAPKTGGWGTWGYTSVYAQLPSGNQVIQFYCVNGGFNFDYLQFTKVDGPPVVVPTPAPVYTSPVVAQGAVQAWMSTEVKPADTNWYWKNQYSGSEKKLEKQADLDIRTPDNTQVTTIKIDPSKEYQTMMGIGTSLEGSSVHNLMKMSEAKRIEVIKSLVDPTEGIGMSMMRLTIGTPDFIAGDWYSYDDMPKGQTDVNLEHFSIEKDKDPNQNILGVAKQAKAIAAAKGVNLKFFASPWSPPGWMKTTDSMVRGEVKEEYLPVLAKYYLKYLIAYKAEGIDIEAMTLQNEPLLEIDYPSTKMSWQQEARLAKLLRKAIDDYNATVADAQKINVKLWIFDHNPGDTMTYPAQILKDNVAGAYDAVDGTAFHDYGGDLGEMTKLHNMYPDKDVYLSERAVWGTTGADRMAQYFRNWAKSYNSWVFMLDSDIATHRWVGTPDPTPYVQDAGNPNNYWMLPEVYLTGQYTKFVKPGYIRIDSDYGSSSTVTNVAFMSPDKQQIVTVIINRTAVDQHFKMLCEGGQIGATIPAKTVATYVWNRVSCPGEGNDVVSGGAETAYTPSTTVTLRAGADSVTDQVYSWTCATDGKLKNGASGVSYANYIVNIPEAGDYAVDVKYNGSGTRVFGIQNAAGATTLISAPPSSASNQWESQNTKSRRGVIHLEQGIQNIKLSLVSQSEWTDVDSLSLTKLQINTAPVRVDAAQADSYNNLTIYSVSDSVYAFGNTSTDSWMSYKVNIPEGRKYSISYKVATDNSDAKIRLSVNGDSSISPIPVSVPKTGWSNFTTVTDKVYLPTGNVTLAVYCDTNTFNFGGISIGLIKPELDAAMGYSLDGQVVNLSIANSVFVKENMGGITLSGTAVTEGGVSIQSVKYIDPTHVRINLGWDRTFNTDGQILTVSVPSNAYRNSAEGIALTTSIVGKNTINNSEAIAIPGKIDSEKYYQMDGITVADCTNGGKQVQFGESGGWVDYLVNVSETNDYTINLKINPKNALSGVIQLMENTDVLCTFNTPNVDNKWVDLRRTVHLTAGQHHLKLFANMGSFNVNWLNFEVKAPQQIFDGSGNSINIQAESYFNTDQMPIEGGQNLGYTNAGNYVDYYINIPKTADYTVTYRYTTAQSGCSISLFDLAGSSATELSRTSLPSTGGWSSYTDAKGAVRLTEGVHTIRLIDNGDGFNLDYFNFTEGVTGSVPTVSKVIAPDVSLSSGIYKTSTTVELISGTNGAAIYYTLDGTLPTTSSTSYNGPIAVNDVTVIRAIAVKAGMNDSNVTSFNYQIDPSGLSLAKVSIPEPVFASNGTGVTFVCKTPGVKMYYTLDGSNPTTSSTLYTGPIAIGNYTIKAIAVKRKMVNSDVAEFTLSVPSGTPTQNVPTGGIVGVPTEIPKEEPKTEPNTVVVTAPAKVEGNIAVTPVDSKELDKAFEKAEKKADGVKVVTIEVKAVKDVDQYVQQLPATALASAAADKKLEIKTPEATLVVPANMLSEKTVENAKTVELAIGAADASKLSDTAKQEIGSRPVVELNVKVDGKAIEWNNPSAPVKVEIDYVPSAEELKNPEHIVVYYIDGKGNLNVVPSGRYDKAAGKVIFTTTHFSKYAVAYVKKSFNDIVKYSWIVKPVEVLASKGIVDGTSDMAFSPDKAITRGEFIGWLVRTLGLTAEFNSNFTDVKSTNKYYQEIGIAKKLDIARGGNGGKNFSPDKLISRQDMMALTVRALKAANKKLVTGSANDIKKYADASKVAKYASEDVASMIKDGLIKGSGKNINPTGNTTRAEAATMLYRIYTEK